MANYGLQFRGEGTQQAVSIDGSAAALTLAQARQALARYALGSYSFVWKDRTISPQDEGQYHLRDVLSDGGTIMVAHPAAKPVTAPAVTPGSPPQTPELPGEPVQTPTPPTVPDTPTRTPPAPAADPAEVAAGLCLPAVYAPVPDGTIQRMAPSELVVTGGAPRLQPFDQTLSHTTETFTALDVRTYRESLGISAGASAALQKVGLGAKLNLATASAESASKGTLYFLSQLVVPSRVATWDTARLALSPDAKAAFSDACAQTDPNGRLAAVLTAVGKYGAYVATQLLLGGKLYLEDTATVTGSQSAESLTTSFSTAVNAEWADIGVEGGLTRSTGTTTQSERAERNLVVQSFGGDPAATADWGAWKASLGDWKNWRIIEVIALFPILALLPADDVRKVLADMRARRTVTALQTFRLDQYAADVDNARARWSAGG